MIEQIGIQQNSFYSGLRLLEPLKLSWKLKVLYRHAQRRRPQAIVPCTGTTVNGFTRHTVPTSTATLICCIDCDEHGERQVHRQRDEA